jgi:hypothetical protein
LNHAVDLAALYAPRGLGMRQPMPPRSVAIRAPNATDLLLLFLLLVPTLPINTSLWSGARPGGLTLRLRDRDSWGTEVRGWPPAICPDSLGCL